MLGKQRWQKKILEKNINWCYIFISLKERLLSIWITNAMVTRGFWNKRVTAFHLWLHEWYQLFQMLPFSLNMLRHLIFGKNIITSYFKAKLVLAAPGSGIYLLQNFTFVYLFNKLLLTVTYLLYFVFSPQNCKFKLHNSSLSLTAVQRNLMVFKYIITFKLATKLCSSRKYPYSPHRRD